MSLITVLLLVDPSAEGPEMCCCVCWDGCCDGYPVCLPWWHMVGGVSCPSRSVALWCTCVPWYSWGSLEGEWTSVR